MQEVVANLEHRKFNMEYEIDNQIGVVSLPFVGMDKSGAQVCVFYKFRSCNRGANCPFRHIQGDRATVCKHWLRGLCKKGDQCEFLHEYDMSKMPECYFYQKFGRCDNKDCQYQHIDPADKVKDCPWYDRGFCKHGPNCKYRHRRRVMCMNYFVGFCPEGPKCKYSHPRWELPGDVIRGHKMTMDDDISPLAQPNNNNCKPLQSNVMKLVDQIFEQRQREQNLGLLGGRTGGLLGSVGPAVAATVGVGVDKMGRVGLPKDMSKITCFKCRQKGHYASRCPELFPQNTTTANPVPASNPQQQQQVAMETEQS